MAVTPFGGSWVRRSNADRVSAAQRGGRNALRDGPDKPVRLVETFRLRSERQIMIIDELSPTSRQTSGRCRHGAGAEGQVPMPENSAARSRCLSAARRACALLTFIPGMRLRRSNCSA
jgi:hypothetical protein